MGMTSYTAGLASLLLVIVTTTSGQSFDSSVCTPTQPTVPLPVPAAALGDVWEAEIEWKDDVKNRTYVIHDWADMRQKKEKVVISIPFLQDVSLFYDWRTRDVIVQERVPVGNTAETRLQCTVVPHSNTGATYTYHHLFWLTSLQVLLKQFVDTRDGIQNGTATIRGIQTQKWSACIYDYRTNLTVQTNLYFTVNSWMSPYQPPDKQIPVRLEYTGRLHNGSQVTEVNLVGDILSLKTKNPGESFPPEVFTTDSGVFCPNRTGTYVRFPGFADAMSLLMEVIDVDFKRVTYEQLFYDRTLKMARLDSKPALGEDSDPSSYIFDFRSGVKYIIDTYMSTCMASPLGLTDDFVDRDQPSTDGTLAMKSAADYFRVVEDSIQYVGQVTVRDAVCDSWIGHYFDTDANRDTIVQWYFTTRTWVEATGTVEGGGAFFMMKVWEGGSGNPNIHNVMQYQPTSPDVGVFDFSVCYSNAAKKHFTIDFLVGDMDLYSQLSGPYLKLSMIRKLADRLNIELNRFTDVTFDLDRPNRRLFMSATLLDHPITSQTGTPQVPLQSAFEFLVASIGSSHMAVNISVGGTQLLLTGQRVVEHNFHDEFTTTTTTTAASTTFLVPTLSPHKRTTAPSTPAPIPTIPPSTTPSSCSCPPPPPCRPDSSVAAAPSCPPTATCAPPSPCRCSTARAQRPSCPPLSCPPPVTCPPQRSCPPPVTCPPQRSCPPRPCVCPTATPCPVSPSGCSCIGTNNRLGHTTSSDTGISGGALAGGMIAALVLGLVLGIIATRLYHVTRVNTNQMTINLIEDNM